MKVMSLRAPEKLQEAAEDIANEAEENLPDRIREFLEWYAHRPGARAPRRPSREIAEAARARRVLLDEAEKRETK